MGTQSQTPALRDIVRLFRTDFHTPPGGLKQILPDDPQRYDLQNWAEFCQKKFHSSVEGFFLQCSFGFIIREIFKFSDPSPNMYNQLEFLGAQLCHKQFNLLPKYPAMWTNSSLIEI